MEFYIAWCGAILCQMYLCSGLHVYDRRARSQRQDILSRRRVLFSLVLLDCSIIAPSQLMVDSMWMEVRGFHCSSHFGTLQIPITSTPETQDAIEYSLAATPGFDQNLYHFHPLSISSAIFSASASITSLESTAIIPW